MRRHTTRIGSASAWATLGGDAQAVRVLVNPLALEPERGGKKNLKIARVLMDDEDDEAHAGQLKKPKLVILGGGWGGVALMQHLKADAYHVVVIAPDNVRYCRRE